MTQLDLRTIRFRADRHKTLVTAAGPVEMYLLADGVTLGLPPGNQDAADFILQCLKAGQGLLRELPEGVPFQPGEAKRWQK